MSENNAYAVSDDTIFAADAPVDARVAFLKKTYTLMTIGLLVFAATLWAAGRIEAVNSLAVRLYNPWMPLIVLFGGSILVHAVSTKPGLNLLAYFGFLFFFGLVSAPMILTLGAAGGPTIIGQAALLTALIFIGLSAYVYYSGKDFGFLGGILWLGVIALVAMALVGWLTGSFAPGLWYSGFAVMLLGGFILYDTSNILRRFPTNMYVGAALELTIDVILLFKYLLLMLWSLQGD
ncbi:MAG: Bax inhibitor-1 family protein [Planctomycetota bacterium]